MGNLRSVQKAVERVGGEAVVSAQAEVILSAQGVILPGVGAFGDAMRNLRARGLFRPIMRQIEAGRPLLGICLGMQLLFAESEEMGRHRGLGVLEGRVVRFPDPAKNGGHRVPHIGWNQVYPQREGALLRGLSMGSYAYFVHSYYVTPRDEAVVLATTDYGLDYASVVACGKVFGVQFHPEKSQEVGLRILGNFLGIVQEGTS
jgi:glutamine amidotransferase